MKPSNKLTLSLLSVLIMSGLVACNNSSNRDDHGSDVSPPTLEKAQEEQGMIVTLEKIKDEPDEKVEGLDEKVETFFRQYSISEGGKTTVVSFKIGKELYGNKNTKEGGIEYVINDLCSDEACGEIVSIVSKVTPEKVQQDTYLYRFENEKYVLTCKKKNTDFEQPEEALDFLETYCETAAVQ